MFTIEYPPRIGQAVIYNGETMTVRALYGVIADAVYGTKNAWVAIANNDNVSFYCSMYDLLPCGYHE